MGHRLFQKHEKKTSFKRHHPEVIFNPTVIVPKFQRLQILAIFAELAILFLCLFPWVPSPRATPGNCHDPMYLQLSDYQIFQSTSPKVDPTLRWSMSWTSSSTCPWLHSCGWFTGSEKTWMTKVTWINFKDLGKIIGPSHSLIMSFQFLIFQFTVQKLPLFFSQLQDSFSIPFLEALPAAVWNALDPWRRFPRRASRNFAAVTSDSQEKNRNSPNIPVGTNFRPWTTLPKTNSFLGRRSKPFGKKAYL